MCGRYTIHESIDDLMDRFNAEAGVAGFPPRYNVAPTESAPIVINATKDKETGVSPGRVIEMCRWGLVPSWAKDTSGGARLINARGEELTEKPTFRTPLASRRCVVPVSGFYEWKQAGERRKKSDPPRQPMYVRPKDGHVFGLAGLWDLWRQPDGQWLKSYTIITVPANELLSEIHERMPAILTPSDIDLWMSTEPISTDVLTNLLQPASADLMDIYPVSPRVNTAGVDDPAFIERVDLSTVGGGLFEM